MRTLPDLDPNGRHDFTDTFPYREGKSSTKGRGENREVLVPRIDKKGRAQVINVVKLSDQIKVQTFWFILDRFSIM